jgi:hypothetical protein
MALTRAFRFLGAAAALALVFPGCRPGDGLPKGGAGPLVRARPDQAVLLRYQFAKDQLLRYELSFKLRSDGETVVDERLRAVIYQLCLGPLPNEGGSGEFYKLNIVRHEIERVKKGRTATGKEDPTVNLVRNVEPDISPNYSYDRELNRNFFPCDARGNFGWTPRAKFHRVAYDSLVYLLPVLPAGPVAAGATWGAEIPVYVGPDYYYGQEGYRGGNDFPLKFAGRVEQVWARGPERYVQLSWTVEGAFDTHQYADRFPLDFHGRRRLVQEVRGSGRATLDVERGVLTAKSGQATVIFTSWTRVTRENQAKWEKATTRHTLSYDCRLLAKDEPDLVPPGGR